MPCRRVRSRNGRARGYLDEALAQSTPPPYPLDAPAKPDDVTGGYTFADSSEPLASVPAVALESSPPYAAPVAALIVFAAFAFAALSNLPRGERAFAAFVAVAGAAFVASMVLTKHRRCEWVVVWPDRITFQGEADMTLLRAEVVALCASPRHTGIELVTRGRERIKVALDADSPEARDALAAEVSAAWEGAAGRR